MQTTRSILASRVGRNLMLLVAVVTATWSLGANKAVAGAPATLQTLLQGQPGLSVDDPRQWPMKLRSLLVDPYSFFRGTADLFYKYCAESCGDWLADEQVRVLLHGDVHLGNLGTVNTARTGAAVPQFGVVDLDEVFEGPFQLDLLRGLTSIRFAAGPDAARTHDWPAVSKALCDAYADGISGRVAAAALPERHKPIAQLLAKAAKGDAAAYVDRYTLDRRRFRRARIGGGSAKDIMEPVPDETRRAIVGAIHASVIQPAEGTPCWQGIESLESFAATVLDVCRWTRVGSSGSQGVEKYLVLLNRGDGGQLPEILELKEQPKPAAARAGLTQPMPTRERARFVAGAHRRLQAQPAPCVASIDLEGRSFLLTLKLCGEEELEPNDFGPANRLETTKEMASVVGHTLGIAHRQSLAGDAGRIEAVLGRLGGLVEEVSRRSEEAERVLRESFSTLAGDPDAQRMRSEADMFIARVVQAETP